MRIIAGNLGGRAFQSPKSARTHPMSDKIRGAIFNMLGDISDLQVLDAFAGSGALSYEAVSRGAASAVAIDSDKQAYTTMLRSISELELAHRITVVQAKVSGWSDKNRDKTFDIVFCDPPYDYLPDATIQKLVRHLAPTGTFVLSWPASESLPRLDKLRIVANKDYGDARVAVYKF